MTNHFSCKALHIALASVLMSGRHEKCGKWIRTSVCDISPLSDEWLTSGSEPPRLNQMCPIFNTCKLAWLTWELNPLICIINLPDIHHHVHPTSRKVLIIRWPGQGHWLGMVPVKLVFHLAEKKKSVRNGGAQRQWVSKNERTRNRVVLKTACRAQTNVYRVAISHRKSCGGFLLIDDSQIGSIIRVSHVCDPCFNIQSLTLFLQSVALNGVKADCPILRRKKERIHLKSNITGVLESPVTVWGFFASIYLDT